ncbi:MAG: ABC transporter ATP-binding protein [Clostridia bacterium]|nr:ABC transporter ATP-binding protein [Clostridia bacterium]
MKKLLKYMKPYRKEAILGPLFKGFEAFFELMIPLVVASIINVGIGNADNVYVIGMCGLMVGLGIFGLTSTLIAQYFAAKAAVGFSSNIRSAVFRHIQSLSYSQTDELTTDSLITRMTSDINLVQTGTNLFLRLFIRSPFIVFGAMIMAFIVDPPSGTVFAVTIPALSVVVFGIMLISIPLYKKVQSRLDRLLSITRENLSGTRPIRAFRREHDEIENFDSANENNSHAQRFVGRITSMMNPLTYIIINLAIVVLINMGALRVDNGIINQGQLIALVNYMSQILIELIKLANLIIQLTKALASAKRIEAILEVETLSSLETKKTTAGNFDDDIKNAEFAVEFYNVGLRYKNGGDDVLSNISFKTPKASVVGIIGSTGSGKTSLVNLIPKFYDATNGHIKIFGKDINEIDEGELRKHMGIVPQKATLFAGTIRSNLLWGNPDATDDELWDALRNAQAEDFVRQKEGGLDASVEQGGRNFSGGQKQRLTIARAIVRRPQILILDDSASALDYATDAALRRSLGSLDYHPTTFIVSQRTASIQHADMIVVLDDGYTVGIGQHSELLQSCEVYEEIYSSQFKKGGETA